MRCTLWARLIGGAVGHDLRSAATDAVSVGTVGGWTMAARVVLVAAVVAAAGAAVPPVHRAKAAGTAVSPPYSLQKEAEESQSTVGTQEGTRSELLTLGRCIRRWARTPGPGWLPIRIRRSPSRSTLQTSVRAWSAWGRWQCCWSDKSKGQRPLYMCKREAARDSLARKVGGLEGRPREDQYLIPATRRIAMYQRGRRMGCSPVRRR